MEDCAMPPTDPHVVLVIANPTSGGGRGASLLEEVRASLKRADVSHVVRLTSSVGAGRVLARDACGGHADNVPRAVVVVGGDGTLSEVVDGVLQCRLTLDVSMTGNVDDSCPRYSWTRSAPQRPPQLVYCPAGTGADFARFGPCVNPDEVGSVVSRQPGAVMQKVDVGFVRGLACEGTRFFINVASLGLGASVVKRAERLKSSCVAYFGGRAVFMAASAIELLMLRQIDIRLRPVLCSDSHSGAAEACPGAAALPPDYVTNATSLAFCNGRFFGGGMAIAPFAVLNDGLLDVSVWREKLFGFAIGLPSVYSGRASASWKSSSRFRARDVLVTGHPARGSSADRKALVDAAPSQFEVDGELGATLPAIVGTAPVVLEFLTAPSNVSVPV